MTTVSKEQKLEFKIATRACKRAMREGRKALNTGNVGDAYDATMRAQDFAREARTIVQSTDGFTPSNMDEAGI